MTSISDQFKELTLAAVSQTGRELGSGAYGEVVEVRLSGLKCAGKTLHGVFFKQSPPSEQRAIVSRFVEECVRLSKLRHPNIVQLIGVHFIKDSQLPMMVMELLPMSLSKCLERHQQIPGYMKTSILYDVSLGLLYLHSQTPPLIHRDLTANNVLLTSNMSAKLADLGVARIVNLNPAQLTARMTQCPGTPAYMPPEALSDRPCYNEKLDIFSFGNLILHVCTQRWPLPAPFLTSDPQNPGILKPLTEVQRRQKYLELVNKRDPLRALAEQCLHNLTPQRPTTANIVSELEQIHNSRTTSLPEFLEMAVENLTLKEQFEKEKQCFTEGNKQIKKFCEEITHLKQENVLLKKENFFLKQEVHEKEGIIAQLRKERPSAALASVKRYSQPIRTISCLGEPMRVAVTANGNMIIVTENMDDCVIIFNKKGSKIRSFGSRGNGKGQFNEPMGVAITSDSHILVADTCNCRVQKFTMVGKYVSSVGSNGSGPLQFILPYGLAIHPSGKIFIIEHIGNRVQVLNPDLSYSHMFGSEGTAPGQFSNPWDVACDSQGMVYVADSVNHRVQKFTSEGKFVMVIGGKGSRTGELNSPVSLAIDHMDKVYVGESGNQRISVFTSDGEFLYCIVDEMLNPWGLAFDQNGHLYVYDFGNYRVLVY